VADLNDDAVTDYFEYLDMLERVEAAATAYLATGQRWPDEERDFVDGWPWLVRDGVAVESVEGASA
jgi:hypothetical protein